MADSKNPNQPAAATSTTEADAAARALASRSKQRREDDLRAAMLNARKRKAPAAPAPGPSLGDGYRLQNISDQPIDGIEPGDVFDVSHWSKQKLDRVVSSREGLVALGPDDKARVLEEAKAS